MKKTEKKDEKEQWQRKQKREREWIRGKMGKLLQEELLTQLTEKKGLRQDENYPQEERCSPLLPLLALQGIGEPLPLEV